MNFLPSIGIISEYGREKQTLIVNNQVDAIKLLCSQNYFVWCFQ